MRKGKKMNCEVIGNQKSKISNVYYNERAKKIIIKIVNKLVMFDDVYKNLYRSIYIKEARKDKKISQTHATNRAKRKMAQKFIKDLYYTWKALEKEVVR